MLFTSAIVVEDQWKLNFQKIYLNESLCPKYRQLCRKFSVLFIGGKGTGFYTANGRIKDKTNEDQTKIIGHNVDLIQQLEKKGIHHVIYIYIYIYYIYIYIYI